MTRMLSFFIALIILNNCLWAQNNETTLTDIQTINKFGTTSIQNYKGGQTYKAAISIDDQHKQDDGLDRLRFLLTDEQGNTVIDSDFKTIDKYFSIDCIDLDNDGERDFIFIIRENNFRHIHQTLLIKRIVWQKYLTDVLSIPYAGQTNEGIKWKYNHSYIRQEDGHFHIILTPEQDISNKTISHLPVKPVCINIGDKSGLHDLKEPETNNPLKWYHPQEYFIPNLLGNTGYTVRVINPDDPNSPPQRDSLRIIQVVDKDGNVFAERPYRGYFGGCSFTLFDIDEDGDMEFFILLQTNSGTGVCGEEISIDKIVNGQFIPLLTYPVAEENTMTGAWAFSEWKYRGYGLNNPSNVAFEMVLNYSTSDRYKEDVIPDIFPRADKMVILFEKDKYSINFIYSADPGKRPLSRENDTGPHWGLPSGWSWGWIFK